MHVGAEMFFSSRGNFDRPAGTPVSTERAAVQRGLAELRELPLQGPDRRRRLGVRRRPAQVGAAERARFNPRNRDEQRVLNYSAIFDEVEDFEANIRNVSGPGPLAAAAARAATRRRRRARSTRPTACCSATTATPTVAPCVINAFAKPNAGRAAVHGHAARQHRRRSRRSTALREWVRVRRAHAERRRSRRDAAGGGVDAPRTIAQGRSALPGRRLRELPRRRRRGRRAARTSSRRPPRPRSRPRPTPPPTGRRSPRSARSTSTRFLRDIGSFNLGVPGGGNDSAPNIGGDEKAAAGARRRRRAAAAATASASTTTATARATASTCRRCWASTPCRPTTTTAPARRSPASSTTSSTARPTARGRTAPRPRRRRR